MTQSPQHDLLALASQALSAGDLRLARACLGRMEDQALTGEEQRERQRLVTALTLDPLSLATAGVSLLLLVVVVLALYV